MNTNTEYPSMNVGSLSINTFNNGLTIMDRNTFPVSVFLKTDVSMNRMILNGDLVINGNFSLNGGLTISKLVMNNQQYETPINAATVTIDPTKTILIIDPVGPLATLTIDMPVNPPDGAIVQIAITRDIGAINHTAPGGAIIDFPLISAVAPSTQHYYYRAINNTWHIIVTAEGPSSVTLTCIQDQIPNPNVQLCTGATALQGFFNNGTDKYMDVSMVGRNVALGFHANNSVVGGTDNIAIGNNALASNVTSNTNIAIGNGSLQNTTGVGNNIGIGSGSLNSNITGNQNVALGTSALNVAVAGNQNVAIGVQSIALLTSGNDNTSVGYLALSSAGVFNGIVAMGSNALQSNTASTECTAIGFHSLENNTIGTNNTASGYNTLNLNISGINNTAIGHNALQNNTGDFNTGVGSSALRTNTTGDNNTALGYNALVVNIGNDNIAVGANALVVNTTGDSNTAIGVDALVAVITGSGNIAFGDSAGSALLLNDNIAIGNVGLATDAGIIRIGTAGTHTNTFVPTNLHVGVTGAPGSGYLGLLNEYVDVSGPYGDGAIIPNPTVVFGGPAISIWIIPLSASALPTGLTVTMPAPVSLGQTMHISFVGVAGPPVVIGTGIIYTPAVDVAHTADVTAILTGANAFSSSWYVSPGSGLWTRI